MTLTRFIEVTSIIVVWVIMITLLIYNNGTIPPSPINGVIGCFFIGLFFLIQYMKPFNYLTIKRLGSMKESAIVELKYDKVLHKLYGRVDGTRFWIPIEGYVVSYLTANNSLTDFLSKKLSVKELREFMFTTLIDSTYRKYRRLDKKNDLFVANFMVFVTLIIFFIMYIIEL